MCRDCLVELLQRVKEIDALILISLRDKTPQYGMVLEDLQDELGMKRSRVYESVNRLQFIGAVDYLREERCNKYYITHVGRDILDLLDEQIENLL